MENKKRLIEIPEDGIIRIPIMAGEATVGEKRIDLSHIPTVDAVEVVHGRWDAYDCYKCDSDGNPVIKTAEVFVCSICGREERHREPYCHCGAKMDGDENG